MKTKECMKKWPKKYKDIFLYHILDIWNLLLKNIMQPQLGDYISFLPNQNTPEHERGNNNYPGITRQTKSATLLTRDKTFLIRQLHHSKHRS